MSLGVKKSKSLHVNMQLSIQENKHPFICELLKVGDSKGVSLVALHYMLLILGMRAVKTW